MKPRTEAVISPNGQVIITRPSNIRNAPDVLDQYPSVDAAAESLLSRRREHRTLAMSDVVDGAALLVAGVLISMLGGPVPVLISFLLEFCGSGFLLNSIPKMRNARRETQYLHAVRKAQQPPIA